MMILSMYFIFIPDKLFYIITLFITVVCIKNCNNKRTLIARDTRKN